MRLIRRPSSARRRGPRYRAANPATTSSGVSARRGRIPVPDLSWEVALNLACSLLTIGHPRQPEAIQATALDLQAWCKGTTLNGRTITPDDQALGLVMEIRSTWEGWP